MKKTIFLLFFIYSLISLPAHALDPKMDILGRKMEGELHFPPVSIETLPNGMKLYLLEDHELPIFEVYAYIRGGSIEDPPEKVGLLSLVSTVLRTGGTQQRTVKEIDRMLEDRGASIETGMEHEYGTAELRCLSENINELLPLFFEILSKPRFDPAQIDLARARMIESLKRENDVPERIAFREYPKLLYGDQSVWARVSDSKSLKGIDRNDLLHTHEMFYHPDRVILAIAGDFRKEDLLKLIQKNTEGWKKSAAKLASIESVKKEWQPGIFGVDKKGPQSTILLGHFGDKRFNPDKFALILMNYMLGGDIFSSRLGEEVRSSRGLAYSVFSHFGLETDYGLFYAVAETQTPATGEVIELIQKEIGHFHDGSGFSEASLRFAKEAIINQMTGEWEPPFNFVKERARLGFYGYPENYLEVYRQYLKAVTLAQVKEAAHRYLYPDRLKILVVGDLGKVDGQLKKWGEMKRISLPSY
jgi:zinc protease